MRELSRDEILAYRRRVSALDQRLAPTNESLQRAAWAGLQDSMPRAALLSIHARIDEATPVHWEQESLVQIWGPRYSVYVIAAVDLPIFTLARLPDAEKGRRRAEETADVLERFLEGRRMKDRAIYAALVDHPYSLRYATATGRVLIRWEGALAPTVWMVPRPTMSAADARLELARRFLHVFGPATEASFAKWAGIPLPSGVAAFKQLNSEFAAVATPIGPALMLAGDEDAVRSKHGPAAPARLLPSGDTYYLLWGRDRELLVPDAHRRAELWTSRVWPGALLIGGDVVGTWRRSNEKLFIDAWRTLTAAEQEATEAEAASLPLPLAGKEIRVSWSSSGG